MFLMKSSGSFERYFRAVSYLVALSGLFALFASGGVGILVFALFVLVASGAWFLEDSKWQLSERIAVTIVAVALIGFVADWRFRFTGIWANGLFAAAGLARLILFLAAVKLLQKKADKDWILIYLISFFEVLLAAGLSISPLYLVSLFAYLFFTTCAIIAFEIRKSSRAGVDPKEKSLRSGIRRLAEKADGEGAPTPVWRLSSASIVLLVFITLVGLPVFFSLPRGNAAGFGGDQTNPVNVTGFSDSVSLGTIGSLLQNDAIVMRVRIDKNNNRAMDRVKWRGVALDKFDNRNWTKSNPLNRRSFGKNRNNLVLLDYPNRTGRITIQTFYLEPMNTPVLFALKRPFALSGVNIVSKDAEGALHGIRGGIERMSYSVYSDTFEPEADVLRADTSAYTAAYARYLQVPGNMDPGIKQIADKYVSNANAANRYDIAKGIETQLQNDFAYSLEMKAGGPQPLADFLFRVKAGHCEYFASSMAMMLRTQGIATRIVNGFQSGDFNSTAGVYIVRQKHAHSWVEVYFPESNSWVTFDPTPPDPNVSTNSYFAAFSGYVEALETFWIQYVVAYDGQEQRSLFRSFRDGIGDYLNAGSVSVASLQSLMMSYWEDLRGDQGAIAGLRAAGIGLGVLITFVFLYFFVRTAVRFAIRLSAFKWIRKKLGRTGDTETVVFYQDMQRILSRFGIVRERFQTPLEFASETGLTEVNSITERYNRVRFGRELLDKAEHEAIELELRSIREKLKQE